TCQRNPNPTRPTPKDSVQPSEDQKALAFSTLLSSQETDTHRLDSDFRRTPSGATLLSYRSRPACQPPDPKILKSTEQDQHGPARQQSPRPAKTGRSSHIQKFPSGPTTAL